MVTGVIVLALEGRHDFFLLYQLIGKEKGVGIFFFVVGDGLNLYHMEFSLKLSCVLDTSLYEGRVLFSCSF